MKKLLICFLLAFPAIVWSQDFKMIRSSIDTTVTAISTPTGFGNIYYNKLRSQWWIVEGGVKKRLYSSGSSGITVGTTAITSGISTRIPFNDGGVYGEDSDFTFDKTTNVFTSGNFSGKLNTGYITMYGLPNNSGASIMVGNSNGNAGITGTFNSGYGHQLFTSLTTGSDNVAIGYQALGAIANATGNVGIGFQAGGGMSTNAGLNVVIGWRAGYNITTGYNNVVLGPNIDAPIAAGGYQLSIQNIIFGTDNSGTGTTVSGGMIGIGTNAPDRRFHVEQDNAATNTVTNVARITSTSTDTPANGIGVGMEFEVETAAANNEVGAIIEAVTTDVTATSEDFDLVFKTMAGGAAANEKLRLTSDGRLYGTALHNNSGAVTGTTNQYIASGTYTPTLYNTTNVAASTAYECMWTRVGNIVNVSGAIDIDPTATGSTFLELTIPIESAFSNGIKLAGVANCDTVSQPASVYSDPTNDRAIITYIATDTSSRTFRFTFQYNIL